MPITFQKECTIRVNPDCLMWYYACMKQDKSHLILNRYAVGILATLIIVAASVAIATRHNHTNAAPIPKSSLSGPVQSQFSFSANSAPNWRKGPSNKTSLALFYNPYDCFTSVEYKSGTVNIAAELRKSQVDLDGSGYTSTPGTILPVTLRTDTGRQQYKLQQYIVTGTGSLGKPYGGHEFGYLQLSGGYVKIEGYCDTVTHLSATIPALEAIKFNKTE